MDGDDDNSSQRSVACAIREFDGEGDLGVHAFACLPRRGEVVELWTEGEDLVARVVEIHHPEISPEGERLEDCDVVLYVEIIPA